jgi:hypothetical protein
LAKKFAVYMLLDMQRTLSFPPVDSPEVESNPVFNVVIAYEDFETGKHAKETYDFLAQNIGRDCQLTNQMWKFDVLSIPKLREIAMRDATTADIILISCHGDPLPEYVTKWAESWVMQGTHALALVALFDRPETQGGTVKSVREYLAAIAKRSQMEFFAQPDIWPGAMHRSNSLYIQPDSNATQRTLSTLAGTMRRDVTPRWGINE